MSSGSSRLIGFTGHQAMTAETQRLVAEAIRAELVDEPELVGFTSLAAGADQIFARVVLDLGGEIVVALPAKRYEESFETRDDLKTFRDLLGRARDVIPMPFDEPSEEAYWAAGQEIVRRADRLVAVWDGRPAGGLGGTADVVEFARTHGKPVTVIWPDGSSRR